MEFHNKMAKVSWADLPLEPLHSIVKFLQRDNKSLVRFRAVCKNWFHSTRISALLPNLMHRHVYPDVLFSSSIFLLCGPHGSIPWIVSSAQLIKGKLQLIHPLLGTLLASDGLDLTQFQTYRLATAYHLAEVGQLDCSSAICSYRKVLLFPEHFISSFDRCFQFVLDNSGFLGCYPAFEQTACTDEGDEEGMEFVPWFNLSFNSVDRFDDIVSFKSFAYILDWHGRLYYTNVSDELVLCLGDSVFKRESSNRWRKRLVVSRDRDKLYLVTRESEVLKVHRLSTVSVEVCVWVEINKFEDNDHIEQVLFVSRECGFFASAAHFPDCELSNCLIFTYDAFPPYANTGWAGDFPQRVEPEKEIQIFKLGLDGNAFKPISSYPDFPMNLWSIPPWILQAHPSSSELQFQRREFKVCKRKQLDSRVQDDSPAHENLSPPSKILQVPFTLVDVQHEEDIPVRRNVLSNSSADANQGNCIDDTSTVKFKGLNVKSSLSPVLQKIWLKHGSIVDNTIMSNGDIIARALESLATAVLILEGNTGQSLNDLQADYLSSTLSDLRHMHFDVDWLAPAVEKAIALHKSKPILKSLNSLLKAKAQAERTRSKLIEEFEKIAQVEKELEEDITMTRRLIPFSGEEDFGQSLGGDLT